MEIISVLMETSGKTTLVLLNTEIIHSLVVIKENQQHKLKKEKKECSERLSDTFIFTEDRHLISM